MGAWGVNPYDNDTAQDWLASMGELLRSSLSWAFWSRYQEAGVAASQLLLYLPSETLSDNHAEHLAADALEVVEQAIKDAPGQGWRGGPAERIRRLEKLQSSLKLLYKSSCVKNAKAARQGPRRKRRRAV